MYYFAYGLNLSQKQMRERCSDSKPKFRATLHHYELVFTGWSRQWRGGVAGIRPFRGERVIGAVYEISEACLRRLDRYEGYPGECNRLNVRVFDEDGNSVEAFTYVRMKQSEETLPSQEYLAVLQAGYREWGVV